MQLPDPCVCPPLPFLPTRCGRTPTPSLALCHPHPVAPTRVVLAPQAERPHRAGWMVGAGVAGGASPGDRKQSSPEQAAPGRTGHTRPGALLAARSGGKEGRRGDGRRGLAPAQRAERPQTAAALMAQQPAALAPGGHQLRSSGTRASPARRHEKLKPRPEAHACTYATPTHTLGRRHARQSPSLPPARVLQLSPFPSHGPGEGWAEASLASRPCTASAVDCGGQRSRIPGRRWAWS